MSKDYKLRIASVDFRDGTTPRIYAVVSDEPTNPNMIRGAIVEQYSLYDGETPTPKTKIFEYDLVDHKIVDGGGERFYIVKAVKKDPLTSYKFQMVRAKTALEAMQASSKALWLRKDKVARWEVRSAKLVENLFDILHVGGISEN